jgi:hypothetical protein
MLHVNLAATTAPAPALDGRGTVTPDVDPIFAAIERHRAAYAAWDRVLDVSAKLRPDDESPEAEHWRDQDVEHGDAEAAAFADLLATAPTTAAGLRALLDYLPTIPLIREDHLESDDLLTMLGSLSAGFNRALANG